MYLYHYYDATVGPFVNLAELPREEARALIENIKKIAGEENVVVKYMNN